MNNPKHILRALASITLFFAPVIIFAAPAQINANIPGPAPAEKGPIGIVQNLYEFSILASGVLAFGVIVYAGFRYTLAAGDSSKQSDAKDRIKNALLGLLLLAGAYLILNTINPSLTHPSLPGSLPNIGNENLNQVIIDPDSDDYNPVP